MNKRQHKKSFINKVYGLSLDNDYVVVGFDLNKINSQQCGRIMNILSKHIDENKLLATFNGCTINMVSLENIKKQRDLLDKKIKELED